MIASCVAADRLRKTTCGGQAPGAETSRTPIEWTEGASRLNAGSGIMFETSGRDRLAYHSNGFRRIS
jgi:hypothetical protein